MQRLMGTVFSVLLLASITPTGFADEKPAQVGQPAVKADVTAPATLAVEKEKPAGGTPDRQAILALLAQLETGFNTGDAKGLAASWTENGEFVGPAGARATGRESIESLFQEGLAAHKGSKLQIHINHLRLVGDGLALVETVSEVKPATVTGGVPVADFVLVKQAGRWLIESAHETITHLPSQTNHLKELDWLLGDWSTETSKAGISLAHHLRLDRQPNFFDPQVQAGRQRSASARRHGGHRLGPPHSPYPLVGI